MDIMKLLGSAMTPATIQQISGAVGIKDDKTKAILAMAVPVVMQALANNSAKPEGAQALAGALDKKHTGSVFDVLGSLISAPDKGEGAGILKHTLGDKRGDVETGIAAKAGVGGADVSKILEMVAPMIMGSLGKAKQSQGLDAQGLAAAVQSEAKPDTLTRLFDSDGDGDYTKELVAHGSNLLGSLFK